MKRIQYLQIALILFLSVLGAPSLMHAQNKAATTPPASGISAEAWEGAEVTIQAADATAKTILMELAKQGGFGLAITASTADLEKPLTLMVSNRPAEEVIEIIRAGIPNLELTMKDGVLLVTSKVSPQATNTPPLENTATASKESESAQQHRGWHDKWKEWDKWDKWKKWSDNGKKKKDRVEFGKSLSIAADEHYHSAVAIGGNNTIYGRLDKDAISIGGTLTVKSGAVIHGSAVSVGGSVVIEPGAVVEEDAVSVGGIVTLADNATLGGSRVDVDIPMPSMTGAAGAVSGLVILNVVGAIFRSIMLLAAALLLLWLVPQRIEGVCGYISQKPGISILSGMLLFIAIIPVFAVLAISIIGIPLIPIAALVLGALVVLGLTGVMVHIGKKMPFFRSEKTGVKAIIVGFVVFLIINIIPIIGGLFFLIVTLLGVGASFQSRFGKRSAV